MMMMMMMMIKDFKVPLCCTRFPWAREIISPKVIDNLGMRSQKGSPALDCSLYFVSFTAK
jgi:hypothetical protein